jgi:hypothetical protein
MATECSVECGSIGEPIPNADLRNTLRSKYVSKGSRICDQMAEMLGCYTPSDRTGFIEFVLGPRGVVLPRTNPPDPDLKCTYEKRTRKFRESCAFDPVDGDYNKI